MTFISEIIFSGFVSKAVNDIADVSKDKIRIAVKNKNTKHQNIESQIYNVIVDVLNKITYNQFDNNQDMILDAAYSLLKSFKENKGDNLGNIQFCLQILRLKADKNGCLEFKVSLYEQLSKDEYGELFRVILVLLLDQKNQYDYVIYDQLNQKLDEVNSKIIKLDQKLDNINNKKDKTIIQEKVVKFQNNRKQKYIENWNSRLFLHVDNDENPITLADAFIMPDFNMEKFVERIGFSYRDTMDKIIEKFIKYDRASTMLILGVPGIGKSSIVSWIANKYSDNDDIIIFKFRDWEKRELTEGLLDVIYKSLNCEKQDLENKILILDGFDEIKIVDERKNFIQEFLNNTLDFENLKIIITSRHDYLDEDNFQNVFDILPFNLLQIEKFFRMVKGSDLEQGKIDCGNLDVLGIPVVLYMAIMTNIDLTLKTTKSELYNRIFAKKGGIFDRFYFKGMAYDCGLQPLRDEKNIKVYLDFLQQTAFSMFEKNSLVLSDTEYNIPELMFQGDKFKVVEFPIKTLFEYDGNKIEFIHKSIYDYFVSEYIYKITCNSINKNESKENLASILGKILKANLLQIEILEFLKFKIQFSKPNKSFKLLKEVFCLMLQDGMTYYTKEIYKNVVKYEINIFMNMFNILYLFPKCNLEIDLIKHYIQYNKIGINLMGANLSNENFGFKCFSGVDLALADLHKTDLFNSDLSGTDLRQANLRDADLRNADLRNADLRNADLRNADLRNADLGGADLYGANLVNAILEESSLEGVDFEGINFKGANLRRSDLWGANLRGLDLRGIDLSGANLSEADLRETHLERAHLEQTNMQEAHLEKAHLEGAYLYETDLRGAYLDGVCLKGTNLENSVWCKEDIEKIMHSVKEGNFNFLEVFNPDEIRETNRWRKMHRSKLFFERK